MNQISLKKTRLCSYKESLKLEYVVASADPQWTAACLHSPFWCRQSDQSTQIYHVLSKLFSDAATPLFISSHQKMDTICLIPTMQSEMQSGFMGLHYPWVGLTRGFSGWRCCAEGLGGRVKGTSVLQRGNGRPPWKRRCGKRGDHQEGHKVEHQWSCYWDLLLTDLQRLE